MAKNRINADNPLLMSQKRKTTLGDILARRRTKNYKGPKPHQNLARLIHIFNRAAPGLGLSPNAVRMMNVLWGRVSVDKDFLYGQAAIVWVKTKTIKTACGWSTDKQYKRAQKELRDAGLLSYKDSSNGVRRGNRDKDGFIIQHESFGFVLTPLASQYDELIKIGDQYETLAKYKNMVRSNYIRAKQSFTDIIARLAEMVSEAEIAPFMETYEILLERYKGSDKDYSLKEGIIKRLESTVETLYAKIEATTLNSQLPALKTLEARQDHMSFYIEESTRKRVQIAPPIIPITTSSPSISNGLCNKEVAEPQAPKMDQGYISKTKDKIKALIEADQKSKLSKYGIAPSFKQVRAAMPFDVSRQLQSDHGFYELWDLVAVKAPVYGIEPMLLSYARGKMGLEITCAAMAIIFDKTDINKPARYFSKLIKLHESGKLKIDASLFGILDRRRKSSNGDQYGFAYA